MKIRESFVANSSSSSFIIGVCEMPTAERAGEIFFGANADLVAPAIINNMFTSFKAIDIDFAAMLNILDNMPISEITGYHEYEDTRSNELRILSEFLSGWCYQDENDWKGYWSSAEPSKWEQFKAAEMEKWAVSMGFATLKELDNSKLISWEEQYDHGQKLQDKWYKQPDNAKKLRRAVECFVNKFSKYPIIMEAEFSDNDGHIEAECEHGGHWDKITNERFSHH